MMLVVVNKSFAQWIVEEVESRGWSYAELGRRANLAGATISQVITEQKNPGADFCLGIARAFRVPPEEVFRRAGILPPLPETEKKKQSVWLRFTRLSPEQQDLILTTMEAWVRENRQDQPQAKTSPGLEESTA
jgi:transcriptional regulator with XRE-family HTH domain